MKSFLEQVVRWTGAVCVAVALASCGGGGSQSSPTAASSQTFSSKIGITGGVIDDGAGVTVFVPADAFMSGTANISIASEQMTGTSIPFNANVTAISVSKKFILKQDSGFNFLKPITIILPYNNKGLLATDRVSAAYFDEANKKWILSSSGQDDRFTGNYTFTTSHFSIWGIFITKPVLPNVAIDYGFTVERDGLPFDNFGLAITPDGNTSTINGSCFGMAGLSGWYFSYKNGDMPAVNQFAESPQARELAAILQSRASLASSGYIFHFTSSNSASEEIRNALSVNNAPLMISVSDQKSLNSHALLIFKFDLDGTFHYYDPNIPGKEQLFKTATDGSLKDWAYSPSPDNTLVTKYHIQDGLDTVIGNDIVNQYYMEYLASKFFQNDIFGSLGSFTNLVTRITSDINGKNIVANFSGGLNTYINGVSPLNGRPLYVVLMAQKKYFKACSGPSCVFPTENGSIYTAATVSGESTSFVLSTAVGVLLPDIDVTVTVYAVTDPPFGGLWAYKEFTFHTPPNCPAGQVLVNELCSVSASVTGITPTTATVSTASTFTVTGANLPLTGLVATLGTASCTANTGASATSQGFTCTPNSSGSLNFNLTLSGTAVSGSPKAITVAAVSGPAIATQPTGQTVNVGQTATFSVVATGTGTLTYQWKKNGTDISGAVSSSYTTPVSASGDNGAIFSVVVTNRAGSVTSGNASLSVNTVVSATGLLTDTGITVNQCSETGSNAFVSCTSAGAIALNDKQDGMVGRDVSNPDNADGKLGFSYSTVGSYPVTDCVKDNITGLMWEGKPATGLRAGSNKYTNYDNPAVAQIWNGASYVIPTQAQIDAITNAVGYKAAVNAIALCGYTDWRLPTVDELQSLVDYSVANPGPTIDFTWFPNTGSSLYWSASALPPSVVIGHAALAWYVAFSNGIVSYLYYGRAQPIFVRLVR
jgi:hypothetical protein